MPVSKLFIAAYGMNQVRRELQSLSDADLKLVREALEAEERKRKK